MEQESKDSTVIRRRKPTCIHVSGKRWFEKTNGNTYHSVKAWIDGELAFERGFEYGYGSQYLQTAQEGLEKAKRLPGVEHYPNGSDEPLWTYCDRLGIKFVDEVVDVPRKKDL